LHPTTQNNLNYYRETDVKHLETTISDQTQKIKYREKDIAILNKKNLVLRQRVDELELDLKTFYQQKENYEKEIREKDEIIRQFNEQIEVQKQQSTIAVTNLTVVFNVLWMN
jgi:chromosome segregation ATPase